MGGWEQSFLAGFSGNAEYQRRSLILNEWLFADARWIAANRKKSNDIARSAGK